MAIQVKIMKYKYKVLLIPIVVIVAGFILQMSYPNNASFEYIKHLSTAALFAYIYVLVIFRINKTEVEKSDTNLLAPINGKVLSIETTDSGWIVLFRKRAFSSAEIRKSSQEEIIYTSCSELMNSTKLGWYLSSRWARIYDASQRAQQGQLIGVIPFPSIGYYYIPKEYQLLIVPKQNILCGETILAARTEKNMEINHEV